MIGIGNEEHEMPSEIYHTESDDFAIERMNRDGFTQEGQSIPGARLNEIDELGHLIRARYMAAGLEKSQQHSDDMLTEEVVGYVFNDIVDAIFETVPSTEYDVQDSVEASLIEDVPVPKLNDADTERVMDGNTSVEVPDGESQSDVKIQKCVDLYADRYQKVVNKAVDEIKDTCDGIIEEIDVAHDEAEELSECFDVIVGHIVSPGEKLKGKSVVLLGDMENEDTDDVRQELRSAGAEIVESLSGNEEDIDIAIIGTDPNDHKENVVDSESDIDKMSTVQLGMMVADDPVAGERLEVGEDILSRQNPGQYGFALPITTLVVRERRPLDTSVERDTYKYFPLLPWHGALSCTCSRSHDGGVSEYPICEHMIYAITEMRDDNEIEDVSELPQRFKRFVHPKSENTFRQEVIDDE